MDNAKRATFIVLICLMISTTVMSQQTEKAKALLDKVTLAMKTYKNIQLNFSTSLINEEAGIYEGDEMPINGKITLQGEKYKLDYLGNTFIFDEKKLHIINHDEKEVSITTQDLSEEDGIIYPSKLFTFYQDAYRYSMGKLTVVKNKKIQFVELTPIDPEAEIIKIKLGIDLALKQIYQFIQFGANGTKTILTIHQFKSNQKIANDTFQFNREKFEKLGYIID